MKAERSFLMFISHSKRILSVYFLLVNINMYILSAGEFLGSQADLLHILWSISHFNFIIRVGD